MAHAFNPKAQEAKGGSSLSSKTAMATQGNCVSKSQKKKKEKKIMIWKQKMQIKTV